MMQIHRNMSQYFTKYTLLLIYYVFAGLNNKLYKMHGTYIKIACIVFGKSLEFAWRSQEIPRKTWVRVTVVPLEIRTQTLPNTSLEFTATWARSFCEMFVKCTSYINGYKTVHFTRNLKIHLHALCPLVSTKASNNRKKHEPRKKII